jgi:type I restriction enzyme S subunit
LPFLQGNADFGAMYPEPKLFCSRAIRVCEPGDILISVRAPVGALNRADQRYIIGRGLAAIRIRELDAAYAWHAVKQATPRLKGVAQGSTFDAVSKADVKALCVPFPPRTVQSKIAAILDTVDAAIQQTEALIAKLKVMKAGLLHDLLMRGLDGEGRLRDAGARPEEFRDTVVGRVPKEWQVWQLGDLSTLVTSGPRGWAAYYAEDGAVFLRIGNLTREHVNLRLKDVIRVRPPEGSEGRRTALESGDVLISITADLGIIGVAPVGLGEAYVNQHIALARVDPASAQSPWVANYLAGEPGRKQFERLNDAGAKAGLNLPTVRRLLIALPSLPEQNKIADLIDAQDVRIEAEAAYRDKLHRLKRGLMADLLAGRARIRAEAV